MFLVKSKDSTPKKYRGPELKLMATFQEVLLVIHLLQADFHPDKIEEIMTSKLLDHCLRIHSVPPLSFSVWRKSLINAYKHILRMGEGPVMIPPPQLDKRLVVLTKILFFLIEKAVTLVLLPVPILMTPLAILNHRKVAGKYHNTKREIIHLLGDIYLQSVQLNGENVALAKQDIEKLIDENLSELFIVARKFSFPLPETMTSNELIDEKKPCVVIYNYSEDSLALARELDRQNQMNVIIVDPTKSNTTVTRDKQIVTISGAVYKDEKLYCGKFKQPTEADYVFCGGVLNTDIIERIEGCDVPTSGLPYMLEYTENKELTKHILVEHGVNMAPSICWKSPTQMSPFLKSKEEQDLVQYSNSHHLFSIAADLHDFCENHDCSEIVVKPTDGQGGSGVIFFKSNSLRAAAMAIQKLREEGHNVIVEKRIFSVPLDKMDQKKDWNIRAFISRDKNNQYMVSDLEIRMDDDGKPVNISISASVISFEMLCQKLGLSSERAEHFRKQINDIAIRTCQVLEETIKSAEKVPPGFQQDWMGIDIIVAREKGEFIPYVIEANDDHSGGMWDLDNISPKEKIGSSCKDLAHVILQRALEHKKKRGSNSK